MKSHEKYTKSSKFTRDFFTERKCSSALLNSLKTQRYQSSLDRVEAVTSDQSSPKYVVLISNKVLDT